MQKIVCKNCGCSKQVDNYLTMALADFECEICTKSGIDNFRVIDSNGKMVQYASAKKAEHDRQAEYRKRRQLEGCENMRQKFEYKVLHTPHQWWCNEEKEHKLEKMMNEYGAQGWELVCQDEHWLTFKRPVI